METLTYELLLEKLNNNIPFKFLRWGDGEFYAMDDAKIVIGRNEHDVLPELRDDLRSIFDTLNLNHYNGLQPLSERLPKFKKYCDKYHAMVREKTNADILHDSSLEGRLQGFFEALRGRDVVVVSSKKLLPIEKYIKYQDFIILREKNCYLDKEMVLDRISGYKQGTVFLFCASRLSVPAIYHSEREDCTFIDCGSLLDIYVGKPSRRYQDKMSKETVQKNVS